MTIREEQPRESAKRGDSGARTSDSYNLIEDTREAKSAVKRKYTSSLVHDDDGIKSKDSGVGEYPEYEMGLDEEEDREDARTRHWKESDFAVGKVGATWAEEAGLFCCFSDPSNNTTNMNKRFSSTFCSCAGRVGNMVVLKKSKRPDGSPKIDICLGPYWGFNLFFTYPMIIGMSLLTFFQAKPFSLNIIVGIVWAVLTGTLVLCLSLTSFRDPGIVLRRAEIPDDVDRSEWMWSDQALTQRYYKDKYDPECAVVIAEFDHVCPWTGTAIGKNNMFTFQCFVGLVFVTLIFDIIILAVRPMFL